MEDEREATLKAKGPGAGGLSYVGQKKVVALPGTKVSEGGGDQMYFAKWGSD